MDNNQMSPPSPSELTGQRTKSAVRYDLLQPNFLEALAALAHLGHERYDVPAGVDNQWQRGLPGDACPLNHIQAHYTSYQRAESHEMGSRKWHLAAIAFNAMMEFWFEEQREVGFAIAKALQLAAKAQAQSEALNQTIPEDTFDASNPEPEPKPTLPSVWASLTGLFGK